jgi:hypothetical protein
MRPQLTRGAHTLPIAPMVVQWSVMTHSSDHSKSSLVPSFFSSVCMQCSEEPEEIRRIHSEMIEFVKVWLEEWRGGEVHPQQQGRSA